MEMPETRYARSGDVAIAYQVLGEGPFDVVYAPGTVSHVELNWDAAGIAALLRGIAGHARLIVFDKRGTGLSDRDVGVPTLEERSDDIRAVMDAARSPRAALVGTSEGAPMCVVFAASHPERVSALVLYGGMARPLWAPDYQFGIPEREFRRRIEKGAEAFVTPRGLEALARSGFPSAGDAAALIVRVCTWLRDEEAAGSNPATPTQVTGHSPRRDVAFFSAVQQQSTATATSQAASRAV
jgi:pimeloyl-ACP methyl ester carboxylesterase